MSLIMDSTALAPLPLSPHLNVKIEPQGVNDLDNLSSTYSPVSTSSHNITNTSFTDDTSGVAQSGAINYNKLFQFQQHLQASNSNSNKIRKRSANQAYEYLTSLPDSKTFQEWLVNNETDFTWVHKRNSMTNAGKKYYYICNYRIKKGYLRCPAVIYALFPNNEDSTVMVYSCGDHDHRRIDQTTTQDGCMLTSSNSLLSFFNPNNQQQLSNDEQMDNDEEYVDDLQPQLSIQQTVEQSPKRQKTYHTNSNDSSPSSSPLSSVSASTSPVLLQQLQQLQQQTSANMSRNSSHSNMNSGRKRSISSIIDTNTNQNEELTLQNIISKINYETFAAVAAAAAASAAAVPSPSPASLNNASHNSQLNNIVNNIQSKKQAKLPKKEANSSVKTEQNSSNTNSNSNNNYNILANTLNNNNPNRSGSDADNTSSSTSLSSLAIMKQAKNAGMPRPATLTMENAPVHIDVGGCIYTSSLETLTKHPESKLSKMFNGTLPIVLDTLKQHYFIDRDGKLFRHVLNFMRTARLILPENFDEYESLINEAKFYEIDLLIKQIERQQEINVRKRLRLNACATATTTDDTCSTTTTTNVTTPSPTNGKSIVNVLNGITNKKKQTQPQCVHSNCDLCKILILTHTENSLYISGESVLIKNLLPELDDDNLTNHIILNSCKYATKFCLDGNLNVHYIEMMERLYDNNFLLEACHGGGFEGQQYNEYVFVKCKK